MKPPPRCPNFFPLSRRWLVGAALAVTILALRAAAPKDAPSRADDIFHSTNLLHISIEISDEGLQTLRTGQARRSPKTKPKAEARVTEGVRIYTNVSVQLKGYTTYRSVDSQPSLTLNFSQGSLQQKFHGLAKISLNNSLQDSTRLHEKFSREMFAAAGVPVPRADYAVVTLNGRELGLYVLLEGYGKDFLQRHFQRADGNLYEGGVLQDLDHPLQLNTGKEKNADAALHQLIRAAREPDATVRWHALENILDLDRFFSLTAMETLLCHSDTYSMNRNNYRLYHDPGTGKFVFLPHGMDRVLGTHRSPIDLSILPPMLGLVARGVFSTPEGRRAQVERAGVLFTNVFQPDALGRRVREIDAKIADARTNLVSPDYHAQFDSRPSSGPAHDADNLCERISKRAASLRVQFAHLPDIVAPWPAPEFDTNGVAHIAGWKAKPVPGQAEVVCETETRDGREFLHVHVPSGPLIASLRARLSVAAGSYRLTGSIQATNAEGAALPLSASLIRNAPTTYSVDERALNAPAISHTFAIIEPRAPDEVEITCTLRALTSEVWIDASTLRLTRVAELPGTIRRRF